MRVTMHSISFRIEDGPALPAHGTGRTFLADSAVVNLRGGQVVSVTLSGPLVKQDGTVSAKSRAWNTWSADNLSGWLHTVVTQAVAGEAREWHFVVED